ncbi:unnamed protein product [Symbiodinium natans]|uniref:Uncharacterized protein n=1 Tax=Symbiodinium natans TaxID=878477 RepID=A0A812GI66_9DINO|nr:unnamed protein product [Symbiodinium natans]
MGTADRPPQHLPDPLPVLIRRSDGGEFWFNIDMTDVDAERLSYRDFLELLADQMNEDHPEIDPNSFEAICSSLPGPENLRSRLRESDYISPVHFQDGSRLEAYITVGQNAESLKNLYKQMYPLLSKAIDAIAMVGDNDLATQDGTLQTASEFRSILTLLGRAMSRHAGSGGRSLGAGPEEAQAKVVKVAQEITDAVLEAVAQEHPSLQSVLTFLQMDLEIK